MNNGKMLLLILGTILGLVLTISSVNSETNRLVCSNNTTKITNTTNIKITDSYMACLLDSSDFNKNRCIANNWLFLNEEKGYKFLDKNFNIPLSPNTNSKVYLLNINRENGWFAVDDRIKITTALGVFDGYKNYYSTFQSNKIDITNLFPDNGGNVNVKLLDVYGDMIGNSQLYFQVVSESCPKTCSKCSGKSSTGKNEIRLIGYNDPYYENLNKKIVVVGGEASVLSADEGDGKKSSNFNWVLFWLIVGIILMIIFILIVKILR